MDLTTILTGGSEKNGGGEHGRKATDLLEDDHDKVKALFRSFRDAKENGDRRMRVRLFQDIDRELSIHSLVEEQVFYPAVRKANKESTDMVLEAREEHGVVKTLLSQLRDLAAGDETFDAKMKVLMESVEHHIEEEEDDMFPQAEELGDARLSRLGAEILQRKEALMQESPSALARASLVGASAPVRRRSGARPSRGGKTSARGKRAKQATGSARGKTTRAKSAGKRATAPRSRASSGKRGAKSRGTARTVSSR